MNKIRQSVPRKINIFALLLLVFSIIDVALFVTLIWTQREKNIFQSTQGREQIAYYHEVEELNNGHLSFPEISNFATKLAESKGAQYAYEVLKAARIEPGIDMHLIGHVVGDILYKQQGIEGIKICTEDFRNACSHSIVVGLFLEKGEGALEQIAQACRKAPGGRGAYTMCFHGLGHGILAYADYDLPRAIDICKKTGTPEYQNREPVECIGGTIMEIVGGGFHDPDLWKRQNQKYLSIKRPLDVCLSIYMPKEARAQCIIYITPQLFKAVGADLASPTPQDFEEAFPFCKQLEEESLERACFGGFGKEFVVLAKDRDVRNIANMTDEELKKVYTWCTLAADNDGIRECILTAMRSIYWGGENSPTTAINFCKLPAEVNYQSSCFFELIQSVDFYNQDNVYRKSFCKEIPQVYQSDCYTKLKIQDGNRL